MRRFFWFLNKFLMVPLFRLGFGPFIGNPLTGYIMVLKTTGRKTGKIRHTPVNYAILEGRIYCVSGFRQGSDWYHNLRAQPAVELILPAGVVMGTAADITDPAQRVRIIRKIFKNAGFAGFMEGYSPYRISDQDLLEKTTGMPLICIQPTGLGSGAADPGGVIWTWIPVHIILLVLFIWLLLR